MRIRMRTVLYRIRAECPWMGAVRCTVYGWEVCIQYISCMHEYMDERCVVYMDGQEVCVYYCDLSVHYIIETWVYMDERSVYMDESSVYMDESSEYTNESRVICIRVARKWMRAAVGSKWIRGVCILCILRELHVQYCIWLGDVWCIWKRIVCILLRPNCIWLRGVCIRMRAGLYVLEQCVNEWELQWGVYG